MKGKGSIRQTLIRSIPLFSVIVVVVIIFSRAQPQTFVTNVTEIIPAGLSSDNGFSPESVAVRGQESAIKAETENEQVAQFAVDLASLNPSIRERSVLAIGDMNDRSKLPVLVEMRKYESDENVRSALNLVIQRLKTFGQSVPFGSSIKILGTDGRFTKIQVTVDSVEKTGVLQVAIGNPHDTKDDSNYMVSEISLGEKKEFIGFIRVDGVGKYAAEYSIGHKSEGQTLSQYFKKDYEVCLVNGEYMIK